MGEEAEKKYLASLDFDIAKGNKSLEELTKELNTLANNSEKLFEKMSKNMKSAFNIDTSDLSKTAKANIEKSLAQAEKYKAKAEAFEKQITKIKEEEAEKRVTITHRENEKIRRDHEKNEQEMTNATKKGVADRIAEYAKTYLIYQGFNQIKQAATETIQEMIKVESQMVAIERVMEEGSIVVDEYRDKLIKLAYDYGNSFNNVADITLRLAQAGFDANEALALTEKTLLALNTADLDATEATSDMVAVMAQWGLMTGNATQEAKEYAAIVDKINKVADNFPTTSADIMDALKKTSSAFNLAGASIDETIATIVAAEKASQRGGKAIGTALSNITQQLKDTKRMATAEELGINFYTDETKTEFKSLMEIFEQLSEKMQQLKAEGKESSVEMQDLLSVFTVFRRNIGASLLGEMAGETSTYAQVLETSINSIGYSINENEKYMRTAEAAQQQFNATLLELKTSVWDNGLEKVFRSMLLMGSDLANGIKVLVDTFGTLPVVIGTATLALTVFSKKMKIESIRQNIQRMKELNNIIAMYNNSVVKGNASTKIFLETLGDNVDPSLRTYITNLDGAKASLSGYTAQTVLATAKTLIFQATLSFGLSLAITAVVSAIDNYIHAQEKTREKIEDNIAALKDEINQYKEEVSIINSVVEEYQKIGEKGNFTQEEQTKILELQSDIKNITSETAKAVDLVNGSYDEQLAKIRQIRDEELQALAEKKKSVIEENIKDFSIGITNDAIAQTTQLNLFSPEFSKDYEEYIAKNQELSEELFYGSAQQQKKALEELQESLREASKESGQLYKWVEDQLDDLNKRQEAINESTKDYAKTIAQINVNKWFLDDEKIKSLDDFQNAINLINDAPIERNRWIKRSND